VADKAFVCLCLDLTEDDLDQAIAEGFTDAETLKRYTACFMGPCQGKSCMETILTLLSEKTGQDRDAIRQPTLRPPIHPIPLGLIAGLDKIDET
jgi:bacterioferritin-associated ferredoxin